MIMNEEQRAAYIDCKTATSIKQYTSLIELLNACISTPDEIYYLTNKTLSAVFEKFWCSSKKRFCLEYNINCGTFSSFVLGGSTSIVCREAVQTWLHAVYIDRFSMCSLTKLSIKGFRAPPVSKDVSMVVFVNADLPPFQEQLSRLIVLLSKEMDLKQYPVKIYAFTSFTNRSYIPPLIRELCREYPSLVTFYYSHSTTKHSANVAMTYAIDRCRHLEKDIPFVLMTHKMFAQCLLDDLHESGRISSVIVEPNKIDLSMYILFSNHSVPVSPVAAEARDLALSSIPFQDRRCLISLDMYQQVIHYIQLRIITNVFGECREYKSEDDMLRQMFVGKWMLSVESFCNLYHIGTESIVGWLNGEVREDAKRAVKMFLAIK